MMMMNESISNNKILTFKPPQPAQPSQAFDFFVHKTQSNPTQPMGLTQPISMSINYSFYRPTYILLNDC